MSKKEKLIDRLMKKPKDFTFDEMVLLLSYFGYEFKEGSNEVINFHKPHPNGVLKKYVLDQVTEKLRKDGQL